MVKEKYNRRKEEGMNKDDLIKEIMAKSSSTKYLIAKMYVEFSNHFTKINAKLNFHDWFIKITIGILVTSIIGGLITLLFYYLKALV